MAAYRRSRWKTIQPLSLKEEKDIRGMKKTREKDRSSEKISDSGFSVEDRNLSEGRKAGEEGSF